MGFNPFAKMQSQKSGDENYLTNNTSMNDNTILETKTSIKEHIQENNIKTIYLQFTDINGKLKSIQVPASKIDKVVNNEITIDSNSITGLYTQKTKTLKLHPDIETFLIFPPNLKQLSNTARFICDIYNLDNTPFEGCVRLNLKKLTKEAKTNNYNLQIGPEVEFFLFKTDKKNTIIINTTEMLMTTTELQPYKKLKT